jgi:hypothetical protein
MQNEAPVPHRPAQKMADWIGKLSHDGGSEAIASTQSLCLEVRQLWLIMVPLIPNVQSCFLNPQAGRFAIPVGDPRMVKTDSLPW